MKNHSDAAIQFSGYPLAIVHPRTINPANPLRLVRKEVDLPTTSIQHNSFSNDPSNWDEEWFSGYE